MTADGDTGQADLRRLVAYSLVSGLCALIPVPLVDDWARDLLRKRHAMELARGYGVVLGDVDGKALGCGYRPPPSAGGCLRGCLFTAVISPIKLVAGKILRKVFRKILFFLTVKDCIDGFSRTFHEGYLLRHAFERGAVPPTAAEPATARGSRAPAPRVLAVRRAVEATCAEVDTRPIEKLARTTLAGSRSVLRRAGRSMGRLLRSLRRSGQRDEQMIYERLEQEGEERLGGLIDEMAADVGRETAYLERLEKLLEQRLAAVAESG